MVDRLDKFLGFPKYDPHGDPIPDMNGLFSKNEMKPLSTLPVNQTGIIMGVREHMPPFLQYLEKIDLTIGKQIKIIEIVDYDQSVRLQLNTNDIISISRDVAKNILVTI